MTPKQVPPMYPCKDNFNNFFPRCDRGVFNSDLVIFVFLKFLADTCPFFWGHWYPCFGFLVTSPLGFKARVGSALFAIFAEANVMYIPQDSPLGGRCAADHFPTCMCRGGTWLRFEHATAQTEDERATIVQRPGSCASDPALVPATLLFVPATRL